MILDRLQNAEQYFAFHPGFRAAFQYLRDHDCARLPAGRHEIDGERLFVMINRGPGRGHRGAKMESHQKYIDIQYAISGTDEIGWKPTSECVDIHLPFNLEKDVALYNDVPETWISVPPTRFVVFLPEDAHAPMGAECELVKAVFKVAVDWQV